MGIMEQNRDWLLQMVKTVLLHNYYDQDLGGRKLPKDTNAIWDTMHGTMALRLQEAYRDVSELIVLEDPEALDLLCEYARDNCADLGAQFTASWKGRTRRDYGVIFGHIAYVLALPRETRIKEQLAARRLVRFVGLRGQGTAQDIEQLCVHSGAHDLVARMLRLGLPA